MPSSPPPPPPPRLSSPLHSDNFHCRPERKHNLALAPLLLSLVLAALLFSKQHPLQSTSSPLSHFASSSLPSHHPPDQTPVTVAHSPPPQAAAIFRDEPPPLYSPSDSTQAPNAASTFGTTWPSTSIGVGSPSPQLRPPVYVALPPKAGILGSGPPPSSLLSLRATSLEKGSSLPMGLSVADQASSKEEEEKKKKKKKKKENRRGGKCNLYSGRWVRDLDGRYPLYSPGSCSFVDRRFACQENGRRDRRYLKWRWKPDGCDLPRFNATDFLERLRGKVMMFVGDSMSRSQYVSMQCLLREALLVKNKNDATGKYKLTKDRGYFRMHFVGYNCSVEYLRSYYLVRRGARLDVAGKRWPTLQIDRIDDSAAYWKAADILIFNTGHWWTRSKTNGGKNFYQEGDAVFSNLELIKAYKRGLRTWASWVEENLMLRKNIVFLHGLGSSHFSGGSWDSGGRCDKESEPAFRARVLNKNPWQMKVIKEVVNGMRFPIRFLNVTRLTNYRKDAHPSIYGGASRVTGRNSLRVQDCSHWCLPGVPDAWNELLYANLLLEKIMGG